MNNFDKNIIETIKARISISSLVKRYFPIVLKGNKKWIICPFHNDKNPSMMLDDISGRFYCFGCGKSGSIFDFLEEYEHISFYEALKKLADECGIELKYSANTHSSSKEEKNSLYEIYKSLCSDFVYQLGTDSAKIAQDYLLNRKITKELQAKFMIGYAPAKKDYVKNFLMNKGFDENQIYSAGLFSKESKMSYFSDRIVFPIQDERGRVIAFSARTLSNNKNNAKYINSSETKIYKKSSSFYALYQSIQSLRKGIVPIICEGNFDAIALHALGYESAVASCGTAFTSMHADILRRFNDKVYLFFDNDDAGKKACRAAIIKLLSSGINSRVVIFEKYKDPCECYENKDSEYIKMAIDRSISSLDYFLKNSLSSQDTTSLSYKDNVIKSFKEYYDALQSNIQKQELVSFIAQKLSLNEKLVYEVLSSDNDINDVKEVKNVIRSTDAPFYETDLMKLLIIKRKYFYLPQMKKVCISDLINEKSKLMYRLIAECSKEALDCDEIFISEIQNEDEKKYVNEIFFNKFKLIDSYKDEKIRDNINDAVKKILIRKIKNENDFLYICKRFFTNSEELDNTIRHNINLLNKYTNGGMQG